MIVYTTPYDGVLNTNCSYCSKHFVGNHYKAILKCKRCSKEVTVTGPFCSASCARTGSSSRLGACSNYESCTRCSSSGRIKCNSCNGTRN